MSVSTPPLLTGSGEISGDFVVQSLKGTNTPCLWISLDYYNLYVDQDRVVLARCHRGWFGLIGFIIGLFMAVVGFLVTSAIGIVLDRNQGMSMCSHMSRRLPEILANPSKYAVVEAPRESVGSIEASGLCLGTLWLKYEITVGTKTVYFSQDQYEEVNRLSS